MTSVEFYHDQIVSFLFSPLSLSLLFCKWSELSRRYTLPEDLEKKRRRKIHFLIGEVIRIEQRCFFVLRDQCFILTFLTNGKSLTINNFPRTFVNDNNLIINNVNNNNLIINNVNNNDIIINNVNNNNKVSSITD